MEYEYFIVCDARKHFTDELTSEAELRNTRDVNVANTKPQLLKAIEEAKRLGRDACVLISVQTMAANEIQPEDLGKNWFCYAESQEDADKAVASGYPYVGIVNDFFILAELMEHSIESQTPTAPPSFNEVHDRAPASRPQPTVVYEKPKEALPSQPAEPPVTAAAPAPENNPALAVLLAAGFSQEQASILLGMPLSKAPIDNNSNIMGSQPPAGGNESVPNMSVEANTAPESAFESPRQKEPRKTRQSMRETVAKNNRAAANKLLQESGFAATYEEAAAPEVHEKPTVVTVYAAKGGVGKTTIAAELATCLALTSNGRRTFRVAVVDGDIEFGDTHAVLNLDKEGLTMLAMNSEVQRRLDAGEQPDSINFTAEELAANFQKVRPIPYGRKKYDIDLYVLPAPLACEDSIAITADTYTVMLRNIIEHGEFDFVICDTGPSLSSLGDIPAISLKAADKVLLVATQDITTANNNASAMQLLKRFAIDGTHMDMQKVLLVINNVRSSSKTGVSPKEVKEAFAAYPCIAQIPATDDVVKANNFGQPLVLNARHEYSLQIFAIARALASKQAPVASEPPARRRLFGRR